MNDTNREYTEVLTAYTINGGATESYSYAGNQRLSRNNIWTEARDVVPNETSYYLYDGRGSVTANTWYNGMVTDVFQYDPYGQVTLGSTEHADFYGYNGESYNPNTGLEFLRARYYNADMGRFFQEDSYLGKIAEPLTLNRYAYGKNSPMNYADPSGHVPSTTPDSDVSPYKPNYQNKGINPLIKWMEEKLLGADGEFTILESSKGEASIKLSMKKAVEDGNITLCLDADSKALISMYAGMLTGVDWNSNSMTVFNRPANKILRELLNFEGIEDSLVNRYLDAESYYYGKYISSVIQMYITGAMTTASLITAVLIIPEAGPMATMVASGDTVSLSIALSGDAVMALEVSGVVVGAAISDVAGINYFRDEAQKNLDKIKRAEQNKGDSETVTNNQGKEIDITPDKNHSTTSKNPGYKGEPNSSLDILDKDGNVVTRRWFDENGNAVRDVDMTNHGNPKQHPEWPHEHFWEYGPDGKPTSR